MPALDPSPVYIPGPIWPADWSQFVPDAIGAVLTGAIIGFVLWRVETSARDRRERQEAESRWRVKRAGLGSLMVTHFNHLFINEGAKFYPQQWETFYAALDPQIAVWADDAPKNDELRLARSMLADLPLLGRLTREVRAEIGFQLQDREHVMHGTESGIADEFLVRIMYNSAEVEIYLDSKRPNWRDHDPIWDDLMALEGVRQKVDAFTALQTRVESNWARLRALLLTGD